jgi:hypothetical protein
VLALACWGPLDFGCCGSLKSNTTQENNFMALHEYEKRTTYADLGPDHHWL